MSRSALCLLVFLMIRPLIHAQSDDFADGNDGLWQKLDPLGEALGSAMAQFTEAGGVYRLQCQASPFPELAGPGRVAALRPERYTDFVSVVEIVAWDDSLDQSIGLLARVQDETGPGVTSGYSATWQVQDNDLEINVVNGEQPTLLGRVPVVLTPGRTYRMVFYGKDGTIGAAIIDPEDPSVPVASVQREDFSYPEGRCGLLVFDASDTGPVDATFDNYVTSSLAPPTLEIGEGTAAPGDRAPVGLSWPVAASNWTLQQAASPVAAWTDVTEGITQSGASLTHTVDPTASSAGFFRLRLGWVGSE